MRKNCNNNQLGLTLVEVLGGIALISIIILLFIMVFSQYEYLLVSTGKVDQEVRSLSKTIRVE